MLTLLSEILKNISHNMNASLNDSQQEMLLASQQELFIQGRTWAVIRGMMTYGVLLLCLLGNSAALRVFMTPDVFNEARHLLLKSMTFCDLIFAIYQLMFSVLSDATFIFEHSSITVVESIIRLGYIPIYCSVVHLIYIGMDRCIAVFLPLRYTQIVTKRRVIQLVLGAWVLSTLIYLAVIIPSIYIPEVLEQSPKILAISTFSIYILILGFQSVIFVKIGLLVKKRRQEIQCLAGHVIKSTNSISSFKASLRLVLFLTTYVALWAPFILLDFLTQLSFAGIQNYNTSIIVNSICINIAYLNSFMNIFVYAASDNKFRKTAKSIFIKTP